MADIDDRHKVKQYTPEDPEFYMLFWVCALVLSVLFALFEHQNWLSGSWGSKIIITHLGQQGLDYLVYGISVVLLGVSLFSGYKLLELNFSATHDKPLDPEYYGIPAGGFLVLATAFALFDYQNLLTNFLGSKTIFNHFGQIGLALLVYGISAIFFSMSMFSFYKFLETKNNQGDY